MLQSFPKNDVWFDSLQIFTGEFLCIAFDGSGASIILEVCSTVRPVKLPDDENEN